MNYMNSNHAVFTIAVSIDTKLLSSRTSIISHSFHSHKSNSKFGTDSFGPMTPTMAPHTLPGVAMLAVWQLMLWSAAMVVLLWKVVAPMMD